MKADFKHKLDDVACRASRESILAASNKKRAAKGKAPLNASTAILKLRDGGGLYLRIEPSDARGWRFDYLRPGTSEENTLSFGSYPETSLGQAREKRKTARELVAQGIDPGKQRQEVARAAVVHAATRVTFSTLVDRYLARKYGTRNLETLRRVKIEAKVLTDAWGTRPPSSITPMEAKLLLDGIYDSGTKNKARRIRAFASRVFCFGIADGVCEFDIAAPLKGLHEDGPRQKRPAVTDAIADVGLQAVERLVGKLMRDIAECPGATTVTRGALRFMALTFPRPRNVTQMEWTEYDRANQTWIIPAGKMKARRALRVALPRQAVAILDQMAAINPPDKVRYVFSTGGGKPMGKNCMTLALARAGYCTITQQCAHGFRSVASTLLNESGRWSVDAIERQLAHVDGNKVRGAYNTAEHSEERRQMLQWYADYLERLWSENIAGALPRAA